MKKRHSVETYQQHIYGQWGTFNSPAGKVSFLATKARLGSSSIDPESRLTSFLRPVREVLPTERMDFNQLLQRDIDDHRVATELVHYLLAERDTGPSFFPPIVAALLPFDGKTPIDRFSERFEVKPWEDEIGYWSGYGYKNSFKFESALITPDENSQYHISRSGRLSWNDERAKLVILDGQHRAMALLAIYRTLNDEWDGRGEKYKHFYYSVVQRRIEELGERKVIEIFNKLELPVSILWFPSLADSDSHQLVARKLFVDVNKNARPPSQARVLLLSDERLSALLMRQILNNFRSDRDTLPIYAIEYDHPERDQSASAKWSAISNVSILQACVWRTVFGPKKYISNIAKSFRGREGETEPASFMRESLELDSIFPTVIEAEEKEYERRKLSDAYFPLSEKAIFENRFMETWGPLIVGMLSRLLPYKVHGESLKELGYGWHGGDSVSRLARDAIFEGVGMYWTIRDSYEDWKETNRLKKQGHVPPVAATDVVQAWRETEKKRADFEAIRAERFLGGNTEKAVKISNECYAIFGTQACQVGFVLAVRSLALKSDVAAVRAPEFSDKLIDAANAGLQGDVPGDYDRRVFLSRGLPSPINHLRKLDSPLAVYFRYFWLEVFGTGESRPLLPSEVDPFVLDNLISEGRTHYYNQIFKDMKGDLKSTQPELVEKELVEEAGKAAKKVLKKGLHKWFALSDDNFDRWCSAAAGLEADEVTAIDIEADSDDGMDEQMEDGDGYDDLIAPDDER